jgi:transposase-like protein
MMAVERAAKTLLNEHGNILREAVAAVVALLMEAEISAEIGAHYGEVSDRRLTYRNGYRRRSWETRVGDLELLILRKRSGEAYFPSFLDPGTGAKRRSWRL